MSTNRLSAVAVCLLLFGMVAPVQAQSVGIGLSSLRENYGTGRGLEIDVQVAGFRAASRLGLGLLIDGSVNRFDGFSETTVMGGIRFVLRNGGRIQPFGQLLVGVERCHACGLTDPTLEPAFGADIALNRGGQLRLRGEAGYRITPSGPRTFKETHILIGISVRPGRR